MPVCSLACNAKPHQGSGNVANAIASTSIQLGTSTPVTVKAQVQEISLTNKFGQQLV